MIVRWIVSRLLSSPTVVIDPKGIPLHAWARLRTDTESKLLKTLEVSELSLDCKFKRILSESAKDIPFPERVPLIDEELGSPLAVVFSGDERKVVAVVGSKAEAVFSSLVKTKGDSSLKRALRKWLRKKVNSGADEAEYGFEPFETSELSFLSAKREKFLSELRERRARTWIKKAVLPRWTRAGWTLTEKLHPVLEKDVSAQFVIIDSVLYRVRPEVRFRAIVQANSALSKWLISGRDFHIFVRGEKVSVAHANFSKPDGTFCHGSLRTEIWLLDPRDLEEAFRTMNADDGYGDSKTVFFSAVRNKLIRLERVEKTDEVVWK